MAYNMMGGGGRRHRGGGLSNPWFIMMAVRLYQEIDRLPVKPPVTLATMGALAALHFGVLGDLADALVGSPAHACLNPRYVVERQQWGRLLTAPLIHADEMHLVYTLSSFLWKGAKLETRMGSERFAKLLVGLTGATHATAVAVMWVMARHLGVTGPYRTSCFTGPSGILLALKAVLLTDEPAVSSLLGMTIPSKWVSWAELALMYALNPSTASLITHLCGVLVGLAWIRRGIILGKLGLGGAFGGGSRGGGGGNRERQQQQQQQQRGGQAETDRDAAAAAAAAAARRHAAPPQGSGPSSGMRHRRAAGPGMRSTSAAASGASEGSAPTPGSRVVLAGLRAADMNGLWGVVAGTDPSSVGGVRVMVRLDEGSSFSVKPENCIVVET